ncbi:zinc ABC transporter substrate-binding protein [bacterium]|nr:zinc ABC transporter substrate-binding protein [bacterium]
MKKFCLADVGNLLIYVIFSMMLMPVSKAGSQVVVSILPQKFFVEKIAGEYVEVYVLAQQGYNPATYDVTPRQMVFLADADIYFRIGVGFENSLLRKLSSAVPDLVIIDTRKDIPLRRMAHNQHKHHEKCADGDDPHIWLDPNLVKIQAGTICDALKTILPEHADSFERNVEKFNSELDDLNNRLLLEFKDLDRRKFMVFHPSWGYFADAYGLIQIPIEMEGKSPTARQLARIMDMTKKEQIKVVFVQPQFSRQSADAIASNVGCTVVAIDPLVENYISNMYNVMELMKEAMSN